MAEENEAIAEAFLAAHEDFTLVPANEVLAQQKINLDTGPYLNLLPHVNGTDGFFAAVFEKKEDKSKTKEKTAKPKGKAKEKTVQKKDKAA